MRAFGERVDRVRDIGIRQGIVGRWFFMMLGLISALGTAIVWWVGGYLELQNAFTNRAAQDEESAIDAADAG